MSSALKHSDLVYSFFWMFLIGCILFLLARIERNTAAEFRKSN